MDELDDIVALIPPLLGAMEALEFAARHFDPADPGRAAAAVEGREAALREAALRLEAWPERLDQVRGALRDASQAALAGVGGLCAAAETGELADVFRALAQGPRAQEALYPLAARLPPVSRFFLDPKARRDEALQAALAAVPEGPDVGLMHGGGAPGARGGWSAYVPEYYQPDREWPLVVALHGGSGSGRGFIWSWLRDARGSGAILVAPTAVGRTWALTGPDPDTPNLEMIVEAARGRWRIDAGRILLAGMSDGGTFAYVSGLGPSPFTHLAPCSAAFHPMLAAMADPGRLRGLPIHIIHGTRDWMFRVEMAREAAIALERAGARVTYREVADLGHAYPRELNSDILAWLAA